MMGYLGNDRELMLYLSFQALKVGLRVMVSPDVAELQPISQHFSSCGDLQLQLNNILEAIRSSTLVLLSI